MKMTIVQGIARLRTLGLMMMVLCWPGLVWAQAVSAPPQPKLSKAPPVWLGLLVMFALLVMVIGVSLMPSKRGHQD